MLKSLFDHFDRILILDTETTGVDCKADEIIELTALRITQSEGGCHMDNELDILKQKLYEV